MAAISITRTDTMPSATPTESELAEWATLSREAQVSRYREALAHSDCNTATSDSMSDVLAAARARISARDHG